MEEENKKPVAAYNESTIKKIRQIVKESLDSSTEITWEKSPSQWFGYFEVETTKYQIKIECDAKKVDNLDIWTFKFLYWDGKAWSMNLTNNNTSFIVFGSLKKGIFEFFDAINPDVFLFVGDAIRDTLYKKFCALLALHKHYGFLDDFKEFVYILLSKNVSAETIEKIKEIVNSYTKNTE